MSRSQSANQFEMKLVSCLEGTWDLFGLWQLPPAIALEIAGGRGEKKNLPGLLGCCEGRLRSGAL